MVDIHWGKSRQEDEVSGATEIQGDIMKVWTRETLAKIVRSCIFGIYLEGELTRHTDGQKIECMRKES